MDPPVPRTAEAIWFRHHRDREIAAPSYLFGPVADDYRLVWVKCTRKCLTQISKGMEYVTDFGDDLDGPALVISVGIGLGMVAGILLGSVEFVIIGAINLVIMIAMAMAAICMGVLLRAAEVTRRFIGNIVLCCPLCGKLVSPCPVYLCPNCSKRHQDTRPGPYGITIRTCSCGKRFGTSLLMGAGSLLAECPHCRRLLPSHFGRDPVIVIPFFGAKNVGKTQLMYTFVEALETLTASYGGELEFADGDSADRLTEIGAELAAEGRPPITLPEAPRAYTLRFKRGLSQRLIFIFDAAGELHYAPERLDELNYLDKARTMIFVVDPLAAEGIWTQIPKRYRESLLRMRASRHEIRTSYGQTREHLRQLGNRRKRTQLAFVISKSDILARTEVRTPDPHDQDAMRTWVADRSGLELGNLVRESEQSFTNVRFFQTNAAYDPDEPPDVSVQRLARWLMNAGGIRFGG
jgi:hypothetical protein